MGDNRICPTCAGPQNRRGNYKGYTRYVCKSCSKVEYVPLEERKVFNWSDLPSLVVGGVLKVWHGGRIHEVTAAGDDFERAMEAEVAWKKKLLEK